MKRVETKNEKKLVSRWHLGMILAGLARGDKLTRGTE